MNYETEFQTIDLLLNSSAETRGVDAFALSLIKAERQLRRIVTHLVYQFPCFSEETIPALRECLAKTRSVYFEGFERGFDELYCSPLRELVGHQFDGLRHRLIEAISYRNKIFHGQLTRDRLSRQDLISIVADIREWCSTVADVCEAEFSFSGFDRDSFQKSVVKDLSQRFNLQIASIDEYERFIQKYLERTNSPTNR